MPFFIKHIRTNIHLIVLSFRPLVSLPIRVSGIKIKDIAFTKSATWIELLKSVISCVELAAYYITQSFRPKFGKSTHVSDPKLQLKFINAIRGTGCHWVEVESEKVGSQFNVHVNICSRNLSRIYALMYHIISLSLNEYKGAIRQPHSLVSATRLFQ